MVARALDRSKQSFRGIRPFNPAHDLTGIARLLEEAFRPDHNFPFANMPFLREAGIVLWTLNYAPGFPEPTEGFVWIEDGKIVGNITITVNQASPDCYYVSNVAVKTEYRRQGIARALVQAAIDYARQHQAKRIVLNVRPDNPGAVKLYTDLGFQTIETNGEWKLDTLLHQSSFIDWSNLRPLKSADRRAVADLLRSITPESARPLRRETNDFELAWDALFFETIADFFTGQSTRRWALEREGKLVAVMLVRGQRLGSPHKIVIHIHPDYRGRVEEEMLAAALEHLRQFPARAIHAAAVNTHPALVVALERHGFYFFNGLTLMELVLN